MCNKGVSLEYKLQFDTYKSIMQGRVGVISHGWEGLTHEDDQEVSHFICKMMADKRTDLVEHFETEVFLKGHDAKSFIRKQKVVVSDATIELGEEVENKKTVLHGEPNCGGIDGHAGYQCEATTSWGFRAGQKRNMDHPAVALEFFQQLHAACENGVPQMGANNVETESKEAPKTVNRK